MKREIRNTASMDRARVALRWLISLVIGCAGLDAGAVSGADAAKVLGGLTESARLSAIAAMARSGQISAPVSAAEGAAILVGTTKSPRASSIGELATLFKKDLSGPEAAAILGSEAVLAESDRLSAIASLARNGRFGPSLADDAALMLQGTTQQSRAAAIGEIAPYLRAAISGQAVAIILGNAQLLSEGNRLSAIAAVARTARSKQPLAARDVVSILDGTTQQSRAAAIGELANWLAPGMPGADLAAVLGTSGELTEANRLSAIAAVARAGRLHAGMTGDEIAAMLQGTTGQHRASSVSEIAMAPKAQTQAAAPAGVSASSLGGLPAPSTTAGTTPTSTTAGSCAALTEQEGSFCGLLRSVAVELANIGVEQAKSFAFQEAFQKLFKLLPRRVQLSLFSRGFLKQQFTTQSFKKAAIAYVNSTTAVPLDLVGVFVDALMDAYGEWALVTYQDSPWTYALVQGYGDQMYVGLMASLRAAASGNPQVGLWEALVLESEITVSRLATVAQYSFALQRERSQAVGSMVQLILTASSVAFAREQGFREGVTRLRAVDRVSVADSIRRTVAGSDIPAFDQVASLIYEARMSKLRSLVQSTTSVRTQSLSALSLAGKLDAQRSFLTNNWITTFGSYTQTADTMLRGMDLPRE